MKIRDIVGAVWRAAKEGVHVTGRVFVFEIFLLRLADAAREQPIEEPDNEPKDER